MRKSSVTSRSSFPLGASSCHFTSLGLTAPVSPRSLPCTPWAVPSRCLRKYSWPLPDEPSRLDRHTNMLRGQLDGSSGTKHDISRVQIGRASCRVRVCKYVEISVDVEARK